MFPRPSGLLIPPSTRFCTIENAINTLARNLCRTSKEKTCSNGYLWFSYLCFTGIGSCVVSAPKRNGNSLLRQVMKTGRGCPFASLIKRTSFHPSFHTWVTMMMPKTITATSLLFPHTIGFFGTLKSGQVSRRHSATNGTGGNRDRCFGWGSLAPMLCPSQSECITAVEGGNDGGREGSVASLGSLEQVTSTPPPVRVRPRPLPAPSSPPKLWRGGRWQHLWLWVVSKGAGAVGR